MNMLNLPRFNVTEIAENEYDYLIKVETNSPPSHCPHCGCVPNLYKHDSKDQLFMDSPMHGKRVGILVKRQRYRCRECGKTFLERLYDMDNRHTCTKRLLRYIQKQSLSKTFVSISEEVGLDEKTIRNIFRDYVNELEKTVRFETPQWLGIDEIHIIKPRCVIANIQERTIVDLLPDRNKQTVLNYLMRIPDRHVIQYVTMDMWQPYRDAVHAVLPHARIIVDKFHLVRMANVALETVRKDIRSQLPAKTRRTLMHDRFILLKRHSELGPREVLILDSWIQNFKELGTAYQLKESFYEIWDAPTKQEALEKYLHWRNQIPSNLEYAFKDILTAVNNWHEEIFAYFDHPITNAYTESLNNLIRVMNRLGRGYSFEALRAKILFTEGLHKEKKPKYQKRNFLMEKRTLGRNVLMDYVFESTTQDKGKNFGVDISTLIEELQKGSF